MATNDKSGDAKTLSGAAPPGDNPKDSHTAKGVVPNTQNPEPVEVGPVPGYDHDSVQRAVKLAGAAGHSLLGDDQVDELQGKVQEARAVVAQRNVTNDGARIKEVDAKLNKPAVVPPVATH